MADPVVLTALVAVAAGAITGGALARWRKLARRSAAAGEPILQDAERIRRLATEDARRMLLEADLRFREDALARKAEHATQLTQLTQKIQDQRLSLVAQEAALKVKKQELDHLAATLARKEETIRQREGDTKDDRKALEALTAEFRAALERRSGEVASAVRDGLKVQLVEEARGAAAQLVRGVEQQSASAESTRGAKRLLGISVGRFYGHYLTERHLSVVSIGDPGGGMPNVNPDALAAITEATGIKLTLNDDGNAVRLEGLDGVAREVARRCLNRLVKRPPRNLQDVKRLADTHIQQLDKELIDLGRKAFATLQIPRAHPEIVKLVGRLNYRTSFTQNQWKHAIEAAFLCGMIADELKLDVKVARRAALMHDIGKALTHEMDGSHAVIGADYARRLGEAEIVANAIGAHHTEEPFNSAYAYLVAAADAMSGARPGARRQTEDNYVAKIADLERITRGYREVSEAFAVQGGREVRIYVDERHVDDLRAVNLSTEVAQRISDEMTFPGQIRVTVIREYRAEENAG